MATGLGLLGGTGLGSIALVLGKGNIGHPHIMLAGNHNAMLTLIYSSYHAAIDSMAPGGTLASGLGPGVGSKVAASLLPAQAEAPRCRTWGYLLK